MTTQGTKGIRDTSGKGGRRGFLNWKFLGSCWSPRPPSLGSPALSQRPGPRVGSAGSAVLCRPLVAAEPFAGAAEKFPLKSSGLSLLPPDGNCIYQEKRSLVSQVHLFPHLLWFLGALRTSLKLGKSS